MDFRRNPLFLVLFVIAGCASHQLLSPPPDPPPSLVAWTDCPAGMPDCNPCAVDVMARFAAFAAGAFVEETHDWSFDWDAAVSPAPLPVSRYFDPSIDARNRHADAFGAHVQGFVRTNDPVIRFAGTHSNAPGAPGAIFFIRRENGANRLAALHEGFTRHPSGVAVLGNYLLVGEKKVLRVFDVTAPTTPPTTARRMPADDPEKRGMNPPGGGIAAVKLADGDYLFVVTTPGGTAEGPRYHRFYRLSGDPGGAGLRASFMGEQRLDRPAGHLFSENLSLVAECGTGRIFAVHTGTRRALSTRGYWRLSVLDEEGGSPVLVPVALFKQPQNLRNCHLKSAATAWVSPAGKMEFYCHEYINNPDRGSVDTWHFRRFFESGEGMGQ
jgi:hypothetical protein